MTSTNLLRRAGLALLALGIAASAPAFTFVLKSSTGLPIKWPAAANAPGPIALKIMFGDTPTLFDGSTYNTSARAAAQTWNTLMGSVQIQTSFATGTPTDQTNSTPPQPPVNEMAFTAKVYGKDFGDGVLAVTTGSSMGNERVEADILFNTAIKWDSYRGSLSGHGGAVDIQRVAIHEMGHLLGLDHPNEAKPPQSVNAIMNSTVSNVDTVTSDDTAGVQSLYGPPGVPANDNFANSTALSLIGNSSLSVTSYNTNATKESGDPRQGDNPGGRSVWWRWTAPSNGSVTLDTGKVDPTSKKIDLSNGKSSYYDTTLGVYTGSTLATLTKIADNDDINPGVVQASSLTFSATGGTTYRFCVDGYNAIEKSPTDTTGADNGGIALNLSFDGALGTPPTITAHPANATVTAGSSASFSVSATGTAELIYQWFLGSTAVPGATSATYNIASTATAQAGTYSVSVTNNAGFVTSNMATLTVNTPVSTPTPTPTPASSSGGGGGGGAPSPWFCALLAALGLVRLRRFRSRA